MRTVHYNKDMIGTIIDENSTHYLIKFKYSTYCIKKSGIEKKDIYES